MPYQIPKNPATPGPITCPYCGRDLEDADELESGLCSSDDCPRWDEKTEAAISESTTA